MGHLFWLSDEAWAAIEPHLPKNQPGARRVDDRRPATSVVCTLTMRLFKSASVVAMVGFEPTTFRL
jgi:transposase